MTYVNLLYYLKEKKDPSDTRYRAFLSIGGLERIAQLSEGLQSSIGIIKADIKFHRDTDVRLFLGYEQGAFEVCITDNNRVNVIEAMEVFIRRCDIPNFVSGDYDVASEVLGRYHRKLQRKFAGAIMGKHVIEILPSITVAE